ncbi:Uncharacterised protein [Morganella morganii]|uniref:phage tail fiber protein n=1 Tax=Morganella morganii TaxID=582 RepID=UPI000E0103C6|nr:hypothetical protein [Morganella morganii]STZ19104.1 Uncharacterised protein [Morganella morganii]
MIYTGGTIAIKAGSPIVTGTGTQWKKNIHGVAPGQLISIENGTAPVSMMIRAVNSDTELVLSFNAPVTLSGAKYSIATTVPDTISDAARTMSANQGYIVYFLQAMQQWMTDTGQVEIELPNGQKVTLDSIKALNDALSNLSERVDNIKIPDVKDASTTQKGIVQLTANMGNSDILVPHQKAVRDGINALNSSIGKGLSINDNGYTEIYPSDKNKAGLWQRINTSVFEVLSGSTGKFSVANDSVKIGGTIDVKNNTPGNDQSRVEITSPDGRFSIGMWVYNDGRTLVSCRNTSGWSNVSFANVGSGSAAVIGGNIYVDGSGYLKKSSPIILVYPGGTFDTNDESEGAEVSRTGTGQYHITSILGYNSDGAWGVNGGISVPKDNNGLELVYVADRVLEDGSIIIETCHRQHAHLPERFQNWRLKEVTPEGERIFYQDGEPCDLPESTRLDVRVEMPQGSVWNVKQRELAEQMEREQAEREAQEAAEQGVDSEE